MARKHGKTVPFLTARCLHHALGYPIDPEEGQRLKCKEGDAQKSQGGAGGITQNFLGTSLFHFIPPASAEEILRDARALAAPSLQCSCALTL